MGEAETGEGRWGISYALEKVFRTVGEEAGLADNECGNISPVEDFPYVNGRDAVCNESFGRFGAAWEVADGDVSKALFATGDIGAVNEDEVVDTVSGAQLVVFRGEDCTCGAGGVIGIASMMWRIQIERHGL